MVIEYQGEQHFKPFVYMGGGEGLRKTQARDQEKVDIFNYYELGIIHFSYKDELTEKIVKERIHSYLSRKNIKTNKGEVPFKREGLLMEVDVEYLNKWAGPPGHVPA